MLQVNEPIDNGKKFNFFYYFAIRDFCVRYDIYLATSIAAKLLSFALSVMPVKCIKYLVFFSISG